MFFLRRLLDPVSPQDYFRDGEKSVDPLFYCLLADFCNVEKDGDDKTATATTTKTCGMGFIFFGYEYGQGPFIYLEDLYIDEACRGFGGGKLMMKELARIALKLGCVKLSWSALDWNTPALTFYEKIGAVVEENKKLTRFCGEALVLFANGTT
jgi:GNAT superfamily N-acetyltransferase